MLARLLVISLLCSQPFVCAAEQPAPHKKEEPTPTGANAVTPKTPAPEVAPQAPVPQAGESFFDRVKAWPGTAWNTVSGFFGSIKSRVGFGFVTQWWRKALSLFGWKPSLPLLNKLEETKEAREKQFTNAHIKNKIAPEVAKIASVLNRMEDDVRRIRAARSKETDNTYIKAYDDAVKRIDDEVDTYLDTVRETLYKAQDEAFKTRKIAQFSFIQQLLSSQFVVEMGRD